MRARTPLRFLIVAAASALAACTSLAPEKRTVEVETPAAWPTGSGLDAGTLAANWWTLFRDPTLDRLVEEAFAHNRDIALAAARVDEARALVSVARGAQLPGAAVTGGASRSRSSQATDFPIPPGVPVVRDDRSLGVALSYEVDFWGRYRDATRAARSDFLATDYARSVVALAVATQVTRAYFNLRGLDAQIEFTRRTLTGRNETVELRRKRLEGGVGTELELYQSQSEASVASAALARLNELAAQTESALAVLLGRHPRAAFEQRPERGAPIDALTVPPAIPGDLPSTLLARRPDIRQADEQLAAAAVRIGVARATYLPTLTLTGSLGGQSAALADLLTAPARVWQLAASAMSPIFTAGRASGVTDAAIARERQIFAQYEQTALVAFREVRDAIAARTGAASRAQAQRERIAALQKARELAGMRFDAGYSGYIDVLDAERNLFQAELDRIDAQRDALTASVDLIRALGGGWAERAP